MITSPWLIFLNPSTLTLNCHYWQVHQTSMWDVIQYTVDACLPDSVIVPKYLFQLGTRIDQPVTISYDESHQYRLSLLSHLLTLGCPNRQLCLIDRFLEGQRAYYTPCQIPSRRCESVHYSIVKWWLSLLLYFQLIFLLSWWVHSISAQTRGN